MAANALDRTDLSDPSTWKMAPTDASSLERRILDGLRAKGYQFTSEAPTPGAHGSRVIFIHPKSCDGVLIELSQPAEERA